MRHPDNMDAAADRQAKQELYEQLLDGQLSSRSTEVSTSEAVHQAELPAAEEQTASTELIFRLERRGEGWGEEIFPHLVIERRPIKKRDRNRSSRPPPWTVIHCQACTFCAIILHSCDLNRQHCPHCPLSSSSPLAQFHVSANAASCISAFGGECLRRLST